MFASMGLIVILPVAAVIVVPAVLASTNPLNSSAVEAAAKQYPNFTVEQRRAMLQARQSESHPLWKTLSWSGRVTRATMLAKRLIQAADPAAAPPAADFLGNMTLIKGPSGGAMALQRQSDCSLSFYTGSYTLSLSPTIAITGTTANYEQVLHNSAGLSTHAGVFANGCAEPSLGIGSRRGVYLGKTTQNLYMFAGSGYDHSADSNALYYGSVDPSTLTVHGFNTDLSEPAITAVAAGDLNGDGLADIVGLDQASASISVWLAKADGTIGSATSYALTGNTTEAAVLADVNGDGKLDVVVATATWSGQEEIAVLTGKGDGTLNAAQSFAVTTPKGVLGTATQIHNLIAADLRGSGHPDIVASDGLVLLNKGDGTFTMGSAAFSPVSGTSSFTPDLAAADFNKDGKLDLAVSNGLVISIYLGKGDGTFTPGNGYASTNDVGYVTATDLDGDGNVDLYVGLANGGFFGGDQFEVGNAYALMGNGDGSFRGAPALPFVYTGTNLVDLNGDKALDAVGVNADLSFTTYIGDGKGGFSANSTLSASPITLSGKSYTLSNIDSYALADVNADGIPDLLYIGQNFYGPGYTPGVFIGLGNGQGGFAVPSFYPAPSFLAAGDIDVNPTISNLRLADINHDGKADLVYSYTDTSYNTQAYTIGTAVQLGNADGTFQAPQTLQFYSGPSSSGVTNIFQTSSVVAIADLNKDGYPDLLLLTESFTRDSTTNQYPYSLQVALGNGKGGFGAPATVATADILLSGMLYGTQYAPVVVADMNGDGSPDIVALGSSSNGQMQAAIALGNGDGSFKAPSKTTYGVQYLIGNTLAVADFNGDGKLDIATAGFIGPQDSGITLGNGDGTLQPVVSANLGTLPNEAINVNVSGAALTTDVNGDGKPDLLIGSTLLLSQAAAAATPDFSVAESSASGTVTAGQSAQTTLTLTPSNGFDQSVSLACSGLPTGATCNFSPTSVTVNGSAATSTLTIATAARMAMNSSGRPVDPLLPGGVLLAGIGVPFAFRRRRRAACAQHYGMLVLLIGALALQACGGGSGSSSPSAAGGGPGGGPIGTPAGSYTVTITATAGSTTHTATYVLTVN